MSVTKTTFGEIFGAIAINTRADPFHIEMDMSVAHRILLISDCHIGARLPLEDAQNLFLQKISDIISKESITDLFVLGDMVDSSVKNGTPVLISLLSRMIRLEIPITIIGGNHDRDFLKSIADKPEKRLKIVKNPSMLISIPQPQFSHPLRVYLTHELGNNYRVRDVFAFSFYEWIKTSCNIPECDWLIGGHAHTGMISHSKRFACIGQFSPEIKNIGYSILEIANEKLNLTTKFIL